MTEVYITFDDFPDNIIPHLCIRKSGKEYKLMETKDFGDCDTLQEWLANMAKDNPVYKEDIFAKSEQFARSIRQAFEIRANEYADIAEQERIIRAWECE